MKAHYKIWSADKIDVQGDRLQVKIFDNETGCRSNLLCHAGGLVVNR